MRHPKFYQYTLLTNLVFCSGLFTPIVGHIDDRQYRYLLYNIFQAPAFFIKSLINWKFYNAEILSTWNSYSLVGPLLNLLSSSAWVFVVLTTIQTLRPRAKSIDSTNTYWKEVFKLNLIVATVLFILWLPMTDLFIRGVANNPFTNLHFLLLLQFELFGFITGQLGSVFLDSGGDTTFGFGDTKLILSLATSFGMTLLLLTVISIKRLITRRLKPAGNISLLL